MLPLVTPTCDDQEAHSETKEAPWVQCGRFPSRATSRRQRQRGNSLGRLRLAIDARVGAAAPFAEREVAALALMNEATRLLFQCDR